MPSIPALRRRLVVLALCLMPYAVLGDPQPPGTGEAVDAGWLDRAASSIRAAEYRFRAVDDGEAIAPNRARDLRTRIGKGRARVVSRTKGSEAFQLDLRLERFGRGDRLASVPVGELETRGPRAELRREDLGLVEWFVNDERGVEHGFTLDAAPSGDAGRDPVVFELAVAGSLHARSVDPTAVEFLDAQGRAVLRYDHLVVVDARNAPVPAELGAREGRLRILVHDAGATYPIVVDPILTTTADWTTDGGELGMQFGAALSVAGDVNGDGFSDLLVGAPFFDGGLAIDVGGVFLYLGSASGPSLTVDWMLAGDAQDLQLGSAVATAGDVDGDGTHDILIGAAQRDLPIDQGQAWLFLGDPACVAGSCDLGTLASAWTQRGGGSDEFYGTALATAGDVNGDGFDDFVVGAPGHDGAMADVGSVYLYHGAASGYDSAPGDLSALTSGLAAQTIDGSQSGADFGAALAWAGDVDADGFADVIVGARLYDNPPNSPGVSEAGVAFVYPSDGSVLDASGAMLLSAEPTGSGSNTNQNLPRFGSSVSTAGDVDGDGYSDVIVGAPRYHSGQAGEGASFVFYGSATGVPNAANELECDVANANCGTSVSTAGDVNGDGYSDVVQGAPGIASGQSGEGAAFLYLGSAAGLAHQGAPLSNADVVIQSNQASAAAGFALSTGDVNGDGHSDVFVGIPLWNGTFADVGRVVVHFGGTQESLESAIFIAATSPASLGTTVSAAGDVNGDGFDDVLIAAPDFDTGLVDRGKVFLHLGGESGPGVTEDWSVEGTSAGERFGAAMSRAGDLNGDGFEDVIIGGPGFTDIQGGEGRAAVWYGSDACVQALDCDLDGIPDWEIEANLSGAMLGASVSEAGDVNGDGYGDVIIGAPEEDATADDSGAAYVYHGSPTGLTPDAASATPSTPLAGFDWKKLGPAVTDAHMGAAVSSAGDVNGDGFSDVVIGASYDGSVLLGGEIYGYHGSASGLSFDNANPAAFVESDAYASSIQLGANLGAALSDAGDLDGDGYSDVVWAVPGFDSGGFVDNGRVHVWLGSVAGLVGNGWVLDGVANGERMGASVAGAGDVNADGFSDLWIGAPGAVSDNGRAYLHYGFAGFDAPAGAPAFTSGGSTNSRLGTSVDTAGDVNGDGYSDILVGAPDHISAHALLYAGNRAGIPRQLAQTTTDHLALIGPLGASDAVDAFGIEMLGRSPAGRSVVALEYEAKPLGVVFADADVESTAFVDSGVHNGTDSSTLIATEATGLALDTPHRWRARIVTPSPFFPSSPWYTPSANGAEETDLRLLPEPGVLLGLACGTALLARLRRRSA